MTVVLTGATLLYGHSDVIAKSIRLMHAIWLVAGPEYRILSYVLSKVISTTTDGGGEMQTITMLDCAEAYCSWMAGGDILRCRTLVNNDQRWLPNALRVAGWSHVMGNAMRTIAQSCEDWPRYLKMMRAECYFWRNATWRKWVKKALQKSGVEIEDLDLSALDHFTGTIAKWRSIPRAGKETRR